MQKSDVLIIGGGLAGLICSLELAKAGLQVCLIEKQVYPFHKVCGEYISAEVLPLLERMGLDPFKLGAQSIHRFQLSAPSGREVQTTLPLGGFGISRFKLDYHLSLLAERAGVKLITGQKVQSVQFLGDHFEVEFGHNQLHQCKLLIGAFGKRSHLDRILDRPFFKRRSPYVGIKRHIALDFPADLVSLHNFGTGYCGVSRVEGEMTVNLCYLIRREEIRRFKGIEETEEKLLCQNPHLKRILSEAKPLFKKPLVINEISFAPKEKVQNHILMIGDAAGLITPLNGNGMAMAMQGGYIAAGLGIQFIHGKISRKKLEETYIRIWSSKFKHRLWLGRQIQEIFAHKFWAEQSITILRSSRRLRHTIIRQTHGKAFGALPYIET